jgi:hypothetical protein
MAVSQGLIRNLASMAVRRAIFALCAFAFVFVNVSHSLSHLDQPHSAAIVHVGATSPDDTSLPPNKMLLVAEHCFACSMSAMPVRELSLAQIADAFRVPERALAHLVPYTLAIETPPPRFSI